MTTFTSPDGSHDHDRLRSAIPVLVSAAVLFAVILGGALLIRDQIELGLLFLAHN